MHDRAMHRAWSREQSPADRRIEKALRAAVLGVGRLFYNVRVVCGDRVPEEGGVLFVCNHVSYADTVPLSLACGRRFRFTSAEKLFAVPILGRGLRAFGTIPVSATSARETIRRMADCVASGEAVLLFPEGQLTLDGDVQEIKGGYELVARRASRPVVMVHLDGLWGSIFSFEGGRWFFKWPRPWRREVTVTFSQPMPAEQVTSERLLAFWNEASLRDRAARLLANNGRP